MYGVRDVRIVRQALGHSVKKVCLVFLSHKPNSCALSWLRSYNEFISCNIAGQRGSSGRGSAKTYIVPQICAICEDVGWCSCSQNLSWWQIDRTFASGLHHSGTCMFAYLLTETVCLRYTLLLVCRAWYDALSVLSTFFASLSGIISLGLLICDCSVKRTVNIDYGSQWVVLAAVFCTVKSAFIVECTLLSQKSRDDLWRNGSVAHFKSGSAVYSVAHSSGNTKLSILEP